MDTKAKNRKVKTYVVDLELDTKIERLRIEHQLNIAAFIRSRLEAKYDELYPRPKK